MNNDNIRINPVFRPQIMSNLLSVLVMLKSALRVRSVLLSRSGLSVSSEILTLPVRAEIVERERSEIARELQLAYDRSLSST